MSYTKKTTDQIKSNIVLNIVNNVDEINDANIGSVLDYFVTSISQEIEEQYTDLDTIYNGTRVTTATGDDLEEIGLIVGTARNEGVKATGTVTFSRNEPAGASFIISANSVISTQPNTESETYEYKVVSNTTFNTSLSSESHDFIDGVFQYKADQRFIDSITDITGTSGAAPVTFVQNTDYSLSADFDDELIDLTNFNLLNDCETIGDWTEDDEADAPTANTSEYYEGTQSINMIKSGTTDTALSYYSTLTSAVDATDLETFTMFYIKDVTALAKISDVKIWVGSNSGITNSYRMDFDDLSVGWNRLKINPESSLTTIAGNPDRGNINYLKIKVTTTATSDTFVAGDLMMDFYYIALSEDYQGDIIQWDKDTAGNLPDDTTAFLIDYVPLSLEVAVEASEIGSGYNATLGRIIYKITNIPNIDRIYNYEVMNGGVDIEQDDDYRDRIQNATNLKTNATVEAIRYNVLDLDFVKTVSVLDTPLSTASNESHIYHTGTDKYTLDHEVAIDDANLTIGNTAGATDYVNGTDYVLNEKNEIDWSIGGTSPSDSGVFYIDYTYNHLGNFTVYIVGAAGALSTAQFVEAAAVVNETRSAGVVATVLEPTYLAITIDITLTLETDYTISMVEDEITDNIDTYFLTLGPGDDVVLNKIIDAIMGITGIYDCEVTDIGGGGSVNYSIDNDEVATRSTITII